MQSTRCLSDEWHGFGVVDSKKTYDTVGSLSRPLPVAVDKQGLGFLSMPGILFTLSFLEF